jgi:hypothetical protein
MAELLPQVHPALRMLFRMVGLSVLSQTVVWLRGLPE